MDFCGFIKETRFWKCNHASCALYIYIYQHVTSEIVSKVLFCLYVGFISLSDSLFITFAIQAKNCMDNLDHCCLSFY